MKEFIRDTKIVEVYLITSSENSIKYWFRITDDFYYKSALIARTKFPTPLIIMSSIMNNEVMWLQFIGTMNFFKWIY